MKRIKDYLKEINDFETYGKVIFFGSIIIYLYLLIKHLKITLIVSLVVSLVLIIKFSLSNSAFKKQAVGNGVIGGGRGKGKGLLLNKRINTDSNDKHYCNVPYNSKTEVINIKEYIDSIAPLTTKHFIENKVDPIKKIDKYEGINIYWDDIAIYAPNYMDAELKKLYPSLSALLPINRHLYNAYMIITVQDFNRTYKLLRELQTDFAIKAIKTIGKTGDILNYIPILRHFIFTKYIYYENIDAAYSGKLPFNSKSVLNETLKHGYLTAGQATKEEYIAVNGKISYGWIAQRKNKVNYDTRYFHQLVYGETASAALARMKKNE